MQVHSVPSLESARVCVVVCTYESLHAEKRKQKDRREVLDTEDSPAVFLRVPCSCLLLSGRTASFQSALYLSAVVVISRSPRIHCFSAREVQGEIAGRFISCGNIRHPDDRTGIRKVITF